MHHRERTRQHKNWTAEVWAAWRFREPSIARCTITVTRYGSRLLDWDNMGGGLKFLLDGMVKTGVIRDDNPLCVEYVNLRQEKCKPAEEHTNVVITLID